MDHVRCPADGTLSAMLAAGEIDALYTPRVPSSVRRAATRASRRLFPDIVAAEKDYYAATGIFPIMHVVVLRREIYERHRWVAQSLTKALTEAKEQAYARIYDTSALRVHGAVAEPASGGRAARCWARTTGPTASARPTTTCWRRSCATTTSRGSRGRLRTPEQLFAPESARGVRHLTGTRERGVRSRTSSP